MPKEGEVSVSQSESPVQGQVDNIGHRFNSLIKVIMTHVLEGRLAGYPGELENEQG